MLFKRLCAALLFAHSCLSFAISPDHNESIEIDADSAEFIEASGLTKYQGNVIIKQGSIIIAADEVTIYYQNNKSKNTMEKFLVISKTYMLCLELEEKLQVLY